MRDILVRIRIREDPDHRVADPALFVGDLKNANKKVFFAYYRTFWRYIYIILQR